ncbi:TPA: hypothetical protein DCZ15_04280 [Candidatus Falkowbacteria bacterium]|nr:MAG: hypothetical protein UV95_C0001G0318 [Candidatus Falkowbacteria bacterium GW2011_GWF2_43_32]HBA37053.1 hypothetical protein [Candidatus Falkowbacteria bacterium]
MKKILISTVLALSAFLILNISVAQAAIFQDYKNTEFYQRVNEAATAGDAEYQENSLENIISTGIRVFLSILGTIFIVLMFVAGNNWMQAAGNEEKIKKSKATIQNLLIGLSLVLVAYALASGLGGLLARIIVAK